MSSYMDSHKVYPTVCKNSEGKSWWDHLGSVILKLFTILKATTHDSRPLLKNYTHCGIKTLIPGRAFRWKSCCRLPPDLSPSFTCLKKSMRSSKFGTRNVYNFSRGAYCFGISCKWWVNRLKTTTEGFRDLCRFCDLQQLVFRNRIDVRPKLASASRLMEV